MWIEYLDEITHVMLSLMGYFMFEFILNQLK